MSDFFDHISLNCSTLAFAAGITGVGVYDYMKTNSAISLFGGLFYGSALTYSWYSTVNNPFQIWGVMTTTTTLAITSAAAAGIISVSWIIDDKFYDNNKNKIKPLKKIAKASVALYVWNLVRVVTYYIGVYMLEELSKDNHSLLENIFNVFPSKIMCHIMINI